MNSPDNAATENDQSRSLKLWSQTMLGNVSMRAMAICLVIGLLVALIEITGVPVLKDALDGQELAVYDRFFSWRDKVDKQALGDEIILICSDSDSARRFGVPDSESIPRSVYAALVRQMQQAGAHIIGLDIALEGPSKSLAHAPILPQTGAAVPTSSDSGAESSLSANSSSGSSEDKALSDALRDAKNVVMASNVDLESRVKSNTFRPPYTPFVEALGMEASSVGNALIVPDADGLVRHMPLAFDQFNPSAYFYKSFALRIAEKELDFKAMPQTPGHLFLHKHMYPNDIRLNFVGPPRTFKMIPLWRALDWRTHIVRHGLFLPSSDADQQSGQTGGDGTTENPFQNKIVLVGLVDNPSENKAPIPSDPSEQHAQAQSFPTPVSTVQLPMSAIELHANAISNILHDRFLDEPEPWKCALICLLLALALGKVLGMVQRRPLVTLGGLVGFAVLWVLGAFFAFSTFHTLIPVVVPIVTIALPCWALVVLDSESFARRDKRRRTRVFRSMAAKPLAQEIERKLLVELGLEGKNLTITVVACQLRSFIGNREEESAEAVMQRLNACLSVIMDCIGEHHGLVERIWNCGVIGIWGAPIGMSEEKQAKLATDCALAIRKRLFNLYDSKDAFTGLNFNFTCGVSTGDSVCGTINAIARDTNLTQYGALGPVVDLAIELEGLNPHYGTTFMLSSTTAGLIGKMFEVREIDRLKASGREGMHSVFELLPWEGSLPGALEEAMALFKQGRVSFEEGRVQEAEQLFATSLRMVPHDKPTMIMLDRCREVIGKSPAGPELVQKLTLKERLSEGRD